MTINQSQSQDTTSPDTDPANIFSGGALGFLDRASERMAGLYSDENLSRMEEKLNADIPGIGTFIREIFNMVSGFLGENMKDFAQTLDAAGEEPEAEKNESDEISKAVYGTGDPKSEGARYAVNMLQRDENSLGAEASIGSGAGGAILEVNGVRLGRNGKPEGDDEEAVDDFREGMEAAAAARERMWDQQMHTIGGVEMSGEEWDRAYQNLSNARIKKQIEDELTQKFGGDRDRAKRAVNDALELALIAQRIKNGTATPADLARADQIKVNNPDAAVAVKQAADRTEGFKPAPRVVENSRLEAQASGQRETSTNGRSSLIASQTDFDATPITAIYNTAAQGRLEATEPATPAMEKGNEVAMAAVTPPRPSPAMNANLDMG